MKNYYFGGGIRRSFMTFGGVVPEIKRLDYEVPYVDPSRIYGVDSGGKVYQKNKSADLKGLEKNLILGSGDYGMNSIKENVNKLPSIKFECALDSPISQKCPDLTIINIENKHETLPYKNPLNSTQLSKNLNMSLPFTSLHTPLNNKSLRDINLIELEKFSTPIKPPETSIEEYSKEISEMKPNLTTVWKSYKTNIQKQIKKTKIPKTFPMSNIFKNQAKIKNVKSIKYYQDNEKLKPLNSTTTLYGLSNDEHQNLGAINSLKEEFEMYRECYKIQKENPSVNEHSKENNVQNFEKTKEKKLFQMVKKMHFFISKCLHFEKT